MPITLLLTISFGSQAYYMLDELILGGEIQETSKKNVLKSIQAQDLLQEVSGKIYNTKSFYIFINIVLVTGMFSRLFQVY
jgi:hypothetical protein